MLFRAGAFVGVDAVGVTYQDNSVFSASKLGALSTILNGEFDQYESIGNTIV